MKRIVLFLILIISPIIASTQTRLDSSLYVYLDFFSNAFDKTGNGFDGVTQGNIAFTTDRFGRANNAYFFDGSDDFITLNQNQNQNLLLEQYTYSVWINPASIPTDNFLYSILSIGSSGGDQILSLNNNYFSTSGLQGNSYNNTSPVSNSFINTNTFPPLNRWYHLIFTRSSTEAKFFIDGVLIGTQSTNSSNPFYGNEFIKKAVIGARSTNFGNTFHGKIDDIKIYNRALSTQEAISLYTQETLLPIEFIASSNSPCSNQNITLTIQNPVANIEYLLLSEQEVLGKFKENNTILYAFPDSTASYTTTLTIMAIDLNNPNRNNTSSQSFTVNRCNAPIPSINLLDGLVASFPFQNNAVDITGNAHDGEVINAIPTTDRFGRPQNAYFFQGNDYIQLANTDSLKNNTFTYSAWVNIDSLPPLGNSSRIFSIGNTGGDQNLSVSNGYFNSTGFECSGYNTPYSVSHNWVGYAAPVSSWVHLVAVRSITEFKLFVNGKLIAKNSPSTIIEHPSAYYGSANPRALIGVRQNYSQFFRGKIDDINIYNRPLNDLEAQALFSTDVSLLFCETKNIISTVKDGNWHDPEVWSCNRVPNQNDIVTINNTHTITLISGQAVSVKSLKIKGTLMKESETVLNITGL